MRYELTLTIHNGEKFESLDKVLANDLIQLMSQFTLLILLIQQREHEEELLALRMENDDIPF